MDYEERRKAEKTIADQIGVFSENVCLIGSQLIVGKGNDTDFLCLQNDRARLQMVGFVEDIEGASEYDGAFASWRKDKTNLIVTQDRGFFLSEIAIAHSAMIIRSDDLDMETRDGRVDFHGRVRDWVGYHIPADLVL